jgi:Putative zinc-finger
VRPDREDPLGPAIRRALQDSRTDCPDAEALAAFSERTLTDAERRDVERHLSECARCRETLLLMSRAVDEEKGTVTFLQKSKKGDSPLFHRWPWLAGAAAAGLAIAVWRGLPPAEVLPPKSEPAARIAGDVGREKAPVEPDKPAAKGPSTPPQSAVAKGPVRQQPRDRRTAAARENQQSNKREDELKLGDLAERRGETRPSMPPAATAIPPAPVAERPAPMAKTDSSARDAAAPQMMARQSREYLIASWPSVPGEAGARARSAAAPAITWRVWASGVVERSVDGGATWTREPSVDAPAARAIYAPSRDVCWIVGDRGLILRFEAGRGWTRVPPPAQVSFVAVEPSDALRATITASDGRRFTTTDGGQTWQ